MGKPCGTPQKKRPRTCRFDRPGGGWEQGLSLIHILDAGQQPAIVTRRPCLLIKRDKFRKGMCRVNADKCRSCRSCLKVGCPAISLENGKAVIDRTQCVGCTVCAQVCPFDAIEKEEK